jgi:hypothetical protein
VNTKSYSVYACGSQPLHRFTAVKDDYRRVAFEQLRFYREEAKECIPDEQPLQAYNDVPPDIREPIYLVEQQDAERKKLKHRTIVSGDLPL